MGTDDLGLSLLREYQGRHHGIRGVWSFSWRKGISNGSFFMSLFCRPRFFLSFSTSPTGSIKSVSALFCFFLCGMHVHVYMYIYDIAVSSELSIQR